MWSATIADRVSASAVGPSSSASGNNARGGTSHLGGRRAGLAGATPLPIRRSRASRVALSRQCRRQSSASSSSSSSSPNLGGENDASAASASAAVVAPTQLDNNPIIAFASRIDRFHRDRVPFYRRFVPGFIFAKWAAERSETMERTKFDALYKKADDDKDDPAPQDVLMRELAVAKK